MNYHNSQADVNSTIPSIAKCVELMDKYAMLTNIKEHSHAVSRVANSVLDKLLVRGDEKSLPDKSLITAGALLHDIAKTNCIKNGGDHAQIGGLLCEELGYSQIAEIVKEHVWLVEFSPKRYRNNVYLAKELIYYADKRVLHDEIVSLEERLEYILERYGKRDPARHVLIRKNFSQCHDLEIWLCKSAGCSADELLDIVERPHLKG